MNDLRQGVTPAQHEILDYLEALRTLPAKVGKAINYDTVYLIQIAAFSANTAAQKMNSMDVRREAALDAAARMILAVELLDAEIAAAADNPLQSSTLERKS